MASSALVRAGRAVAHEPVEARQHAGAAAHRGLVAELAMDGDGLLDRPEPGVEPPDQVRGRRHLLEHVRLLHAVEPVGEFDGALVVGERLAVRLERGGAPGGHERVLAQHLVVAGGPRVVRDVGGVPVRGEQRGQHLAVDGRAAAWRAGSRARRCAPARGGSERGRRRSRAAGGARAPRPRPATRASPRPAPRRSPGSAPPTRARRACATARRGATPARAPRWPPRAAAPRRRARPAARSRRTGCPRWPRTPRRRPLRRARQPRPATAGRARAERARRPARPRGRRGAGGRAAPPHSGALPPRARAASRSGGRAP